ncbi:hypothetical protein NC652_023741 [Populus alba x Populus x berolinensis]|nr:hypothetical protein NC652_023741 [Populus alba x Populus x berolinensis]
MYILVSESSNFRHAHRTCKHLRPVWYV